VSIRQWEIQTYKGLYLRKVAYTRYDVPSFVQQMDFTMCHDRQINIFRNQELATDTEILPCNKAYVIVGDRKGKLEAYRTGVVNHWHEMRPGDNRVDLNQHLEPLDNSTVRQAILLFRMKRLCCYMIYPNSEMLVRDSHTQTQRCIILRSSIFWDTTPCNPLKVIRRLGGTCRHQNVGWLSTNYTPLYPRRKNPSYHHRDNLKSYNVLSCWRFCFVKYLKLNFRRRLANEMNAVYVALKTTHKPRGGEMSEKKRESGSRHSRATGGNEATRTVGTTSCR
jgi:hypothetical protein